MDEVFALTGFDTAGLDQPGSAQMDVVCHALDPMPMCFPLIANNRYLPSLPLLLFSHLGRHLLDSHINLPMYTLSL